MARVPYSLGIDIGASQIKAVAVTTAGELLQSCAVATDDAGAGWKGAVPAIVKTIEAALGQTESIGVSSPGLAARNHSCISWMQGRMAGTQGYVWTEAMSRGHSVPVINDAHAALLGEAWLGAARGRDDVVLITLGTGVGGAIVSGGRLLEGRLGRAGHLGHISLNPDGARDIVNTPGSLEDAIGDHSLPARSNGRFKSTRELVDAVLSGDDPARRIWMTSVRALAAGLVSMINVVDPSLIVIGGGIANAGTMLFSMLKLEMDRIEWRPTGAPVPIVPAQLGDLAGAYGAAKFAIDFEEGRET